jgi:hypothetical protein
MKRRGNNSDILDRKDRRPFVARPGFVELLGIRRNANRTKGRGVPANVLPTDAMDAVPAIDAVHPIDPIDRVSGPKFRCHI